MNLAVWLNNLDAAHAICAIQKNISPRSISPTF